MWRKNEQKTSKTNLGFLVMENPIYSRKTLLEISKTLHRSSQHLKEFIEKCTTLDKVMLVLGTAETILNIRMNENSSTPPLGFCVFLLFFYSWFRESITRISSQQQHTHRSFVFVCIIVYENETVSNKNVRIFELITVEGRHGRFEWRN